MRTPSIAYLSRALLLGVMLLSARSAAADRVIPYRGTIERDGRPFTGSVSVRFTLFAGTSGGAPLFERERTVAVTGGVFATEIDAVAESVFESPELWLEVAVDGVPLTGRQRIQSSPFAVRAQPGIPFRADSLVVGRSGGTQAAVTVDGANRLAVSRGLAASGDLALTGGTPPTTHTITPTANALSVSTNLVLPPNGSISTNRMGMQPIFVGQPWSNAAVETMIEDTGGATMLLVSTTAICIFAGRGQVRMLIDNLPMELAVVQCSQSGVGQLVTFPTMFHVLDRSRLPALPPGGRRTVRIEAMQCTTGNCAYVQIGASGSTGVNLSVIRLPTP